MTEKKIVFQSVFLLGLISLLFIAAAVSGEETTQSRQKKADLQILDPVDPSIPVRAKRIWLPLFHGEAPSGYSKNGPLHLHGPVITTDTGQEKYDTIRKLNLEIPITGLQPGAKIKNILLYIRMFPGSTFDASVSHWNPPEQNSKILGEMSDEMSWDDQSHKAPKVYGFPGLSDLTYDPSKSVCVVDIFLTASSRLPKHGGKVGRIQLLGVAVEYED